MKNLIVVLNIFALGIISGEAFTEVIALTPTLHKLSLENYLVVKQSFLSFITLPMVFLYTFAGITALIIVLLNFKNRTNLFYLNLIALILAVLISISTLIINVPINNQVLSWNINSIPPNWMDLQAKWEMGHLFRTICAILAFIIQITALTLSSKEHN